MTTITQTRRSSRLYICPDCQKPITATDMHFPVRRDGKFTGERRHIVCPIPDVPRPLQYLGAARRAKSNGWLIPTISILLGLLLAAYVVATYWGGGQ